MKPYRTVNEMLWRPDPHYEETRNLPDWERFHRICGQSGLYFDFPEKEGRSGYKMVAFRLEKQAGGGWHSYHLATGRGATVLAAMTQAYGESGRTVPGAAEMLERGLRGAPEKLEPPEEIDALFGEPADAFEDLLG